MYISPKTSENLNNSDEIGTPDLWIANVTDCATAIYHEVTKERKEGCVPGWLFIINIGNHITAKNV